MQLLLFSNLLYSQELKVDESEKVDAVLLLDASASMRMTDPQRLRNEGAKLFTEFLKSDDNLSIIEFSDKARIVRPLTQFDPKARTQVTEQIEMVGDEGLYTDIFGAIELARTVLEKSMRSDARPAIILFSDGMMEPDPKNGQADAFTDKLLLTVLPQLKSKGIKVHTLAFSSLADKDLLSQISLGTGGMNWFAPQADKIHEAFASLFLVVKKPQIVPLTSRGFRIDDNVKEATFYINREGEESLYLTDPSGQQVSAGDVDENITWYRGKQFDVVTVISPQVGDWQVSGLPSKDSFATVLTNLKLVTSWPSIIFSGEQALLQARLYEADKPVLLPDISDVARYAFQVTPTDRVSPPVVREPLNDQGQNGDKVMRDGIFSSYVKMEEPGEYRLDVIARLPTFERSQQIPFSVRPRMVSVSVVSLEELADSLQGSVEEASPTKAEGKEFFQVHLSSDAMRLNNPEVSLFAVDKDRRKLKLPLQPTANKDQYLASVLALPEEGAYLVEATFVASDKRGKKTEAVSSKLQYVLTSRSAEVESVEVVEVSAPEPERKPVERKPVTWPYFAIVLLVNAAFGGFTIFQVKTGQTIGKISVPEYPTPPAVLKAIESLQEILATAEIDLDDPRFSEENLSQLPVGEKQGSVIDSVKSESIPSSEQEAVASADASEQKDTAVQQEVGEQPSAEQEGAVATSEEAATDGKETSEASSDVDQEKKGD